MNKKILRLAIPNIISNITVPLLGLVDLALMGHLDSEVYIGAISLGGVIFNFIYWGFSFLRMGTSGFTAQSYGRKDERETRVILVRALLVTAAISLFILLFKSPIAWLSFQVIGGSEEVELLASNYFHIRVWAAPAALSLFVFSGWFLGMQNARFPMIIAITVNVVNIILSFIFVYYLNMKSNGVALGTAISQYVGLFLALILYSRKYGTLIRLKIKKAELLDTGFLIRFFRVNGDIFIRTFCIIAVFTFFTSKSASINDTILAVNSLLIQFLLFFSFFIDGFAYAGEALVGKYVGSGNHKSLKMVIKNLFRWGLGLAIGFTILYLPGINFMLGLLTSQNEVILEAKPFLVWVILVPLFTFASFIWDGIYIGATSSRAMRNTLLASTFFIFTPIYYFLSPTLGNHALWLAMLLFMFSRGVFQTFLYPKSIAVK